MTGINLDPYKKGPPLTPPNLTEADVYVNEPEQYLEELPVVYAPETLWHKVMFLTILAILIAVVTSMCYTEYRINTMYNRLLNTLVPLCETLSSNDVYLDDSFRSMQKNFNFIVKEVDSHGSFITEVYQVWGKHGEKFVDWAK